MTNPPTFEELNGDQRRHLLFRGIAGSRAYGTAEPDSDTEIRGIFALPGRSYVAITPAPDQLAAECGNIVYYSLRRFFELAANAIPSALEMLFTPRDCILYVSPEMEQLLAHRASFISQVVYDSYVSHARSHLANHCGENHYDAHAMMHAFRLLISGGCMLRDGVPKVRFLGEELRFLLDIGAGKFPYDELVTLAESMVDELATFRDRSSLPVAPDMRQLDALLSEITTTWESRHGFG